MTVIKLLSKNSRIIFKKQNTNIRFKTSGARGLPGEQGEPGIGLPVGGNTGDIIVKASNDDYDFDYASPSSLADKNYVQNFTTTNTVVVPHNLNKYPSVSVIDSAGDGVEGEVTYQNLDSLTVMFTNPFSGSVTCN